MAIRPESSGVSSRARITIDPAIRSRRDASASAVPAPPRRARPLSSACKWSVRNQTNLMVYAPGGYRFLDYTRFGAPIRLAFWLTATVLLPRVWPF